MKDITKNNLQETLPFLRTFVAQTFIFTSSDEGGCWLPSRTGEQIPVHSQVMLYIVTDDKPISVKEAIGRFLDINDDGSDGTILSACNVGQIGIHFCGTNVLFDNIDTLRMLKSN
jgi:hypothetical protein